MPMKLFDEIPRERPATPLLDSFDHPAALRAMNARQLAQLADELRAYLLYSVGVSGGHFGAGLGVVELSVALHHAFNTPDDRLVWDVGHQAYPHKILTGRRDAMLSIRQHGGLAAFPRRAESGYDTFGVGHSSTSISAALGMALATQAQNKPRRVCAIIGDGALSAGMAFEALTHAGHVDANMLVILNDNEMSISENVGGMATYLARVLSSKPYLKMREEGKKVLSHLPGALELARRTEEHMKGMVSPATLFEEMGFNYVGPIDGHDLETLTETLDTLRDLDGPQFLHIKTVKGKGFLPAEADQIGYHAITKLEKPSEPAHQTPTAAPVAPKKPAKKKYCNVFGDWLCDMAAADDRLMGITPAMREGSDLIRFSKEYPERYFDVAIAEQHAVTLAAGMACEGMKPVVAIYSTFLQRGYDQLIHDVAVQSLDVTFAIDRAGLVGEDGPTHHGSMDLSFLRCVPGMVILAPADEAECRAMLSAAYHHPGPAAVRYPRGTGPGVAIPEHLEALPIGRAEVRRKSSGSGASIALLAFGSVNTAAAEVAESLDATLINMRSIKPLDREAVLHAADEHELLVTLEENVIAGGAGSAVNELLHAEGVQVEVLNLGLPDAFVEHGTPAELLHDCGLDADGIERAIRARLP
ncbi:MULTISPECIES: 1-deoxy-D-xylulose-5-phosphate synthase [Halomonadaceae]|uniref:1-deoxy-D-xylulose-5-phosphate synthase n=1 Tax=Vreelandella janggokensis TaxID=370767 RepID=A0ABT4IUP9_9GAMM|nr:MULTISPECIES: 1-deoxy-D-xylulose-5-phosphate synthase [Halomonas]MCW4150704.1 1-deoxy-D-xylulose-5-phosphate synthase [Halomonas sp. 18H]MCZ0927393.1 1-deoxy-D-xylulose-5-phosphate synthase [Halomonas janggokensis]MCZ0929901.1 1-deoxy-D-xylulose-5-phosphate synthase [Halomonas janggokensis]MDR5885911.1 1-deoxy-D-xylulose-5-phosphate synthase [Halomonas janggokensis]QPL45975.1 1-deoxy-D-xylulose-5-phosphate synthase [Halomonas sp. A40-4]